MRIATVVLALVLTASGCERAPAPAAAPPQEPLMPPPSEAPPAGRAGPTSAPGGSAVMATVNGRPIYMDALIQPLVETHGMMLAERLVAHALVEQEAERRNVTVTADDVAAERAVAMDQVFPKDLGADQRELLLDKLLRERGLTRRLWQATLRQNALLARLAEPRVGITEPAIKAEFRRLYGEKVHVSHIAIPTLTEAEKVIKLLKAGQDFAQLARKHSTNSVTAKSGGLLPAFGRDEPSVPRAMRQAAFSMKAGEVSGIVQAGNTFHVLKLHQRLASTQVEYETVKDEVRSSLREQILRRLRAEILAELRRKANVEIVNPLLREAAEKRRP